MEQNAAISPNKEFFPFGDPLPASDTAVTLTRVIKGLGFHHPASVVEIDHEYIVVQTAQIQLYASLEGQCYLQNSRLPSPVRAHLIDRNLSRHMVVLSGFTFLKCNWVNRCQDRVQPRNPTSVTVRSRQKTFTATMIDLNAYGMSFFIRKPTAEESGLETSEPVEISFRLHPKKPLEQVCGTVMHAGPLGDLLLRVGIRFQPHQSHHTIFGKYVSQRREEILSELNQIYSRALEPRRVEDLYF